MRPSLTDHGAEKALLGLCLAAERAPALPPDAFSLWPARQVAVAMLTLQSEGLPGSFEQVALRLRGNFCALELLEELNRNDLVPAIAPTAEELRPFEDRLNRLFWAHGVASGEVDPPGGTTIEGTGVQLIAASDIVPVPVNWLWPGWLATGKLHILAGRPGTGKSTLSLGLAATLSIGGRWPDGLWAEAADCCIWSGEDSGEDTIVPRLLAHGADLTKIQLVCGVSDGRGEQRPFDPAVDMPALERALEGKAIKLLIVDPVVSAVQGDSHKNAEVRRGLQPLVHFAEAAGAAVVGISHFTKNTKGADPLDRVTGSLAFGALPRLVWVASKIRSCDGGGASRLLARAKSNIGPDGDGFRFDLEQIELAGQPDVSASRVLWGEPLSGSARALLAEAEAEQTATDRAVDWLGETLKDGPLPARDVHRKAQDQGFSRKVVRSARERLKLQTERVGFQGPSRWSLPKDAPKMPKHPLRASLEKKSLETPVKSSDAPKMPSPENGACLSNSEQPLKSDFCQRCPESPKMPYFGEGQVWTDGGHDWEDTPDNVNFLTQKEPNTIQGSTSLLEFVE